MLDKLAAIEAKYSQIEARLAAPETYDDPAQVAKLNKEQNELAPVVETYRQYLRAQAQKEESEALLSDGDEGAGPGGVPPGQGGPGAAGAGAANFASPQGP